MNRQNEETVTSALRTGYIQSIHQSRTDARDALNLADADRSLAPNQVVSTADSHRLAHTYTLSYLAHLAPQADELGDVWDGPVASFDAPAGVEVTADALDPEEDLIEQIPTVRYQASLKSAHEEWRSVDRVTVTAWISLPRAGGSRKQQTKDYPIRLPYNALSALFSQADDAMAKLGWLPKQHGEPPHAEI